MIRWMFDICMDMLKCLHKIEYVDVDLLTDEEHKQLRDIAEKKAEEITNKIFGNKSSVSLSYFTSLLEANEWTWITDPHLICKHLFEST